MHFFLHCQFYNKIRANLMSDLLKIDSSLPSICNQKVLDIVIYGNRRFNAKTNQNILMYASKFTKDSHRFGNLIFYITCFPLELFSFLFDDMYMTMF